MTTHGAIYQMVEEEIENIGMDIEVEVHDEKISEHNHKMLALFKLLPKIQQLEQVWIPVEEKLPTTRINVLVVDGNDMVREAEYTGYDWFVSDEDGYRRMKHDSPTHWQPLPLPPIN